MLENYLNYLKEYENFSEDNKCLNKQYLECKEENRKECISKSYNQFACTTLRCGFELDGELAEVYGSCIQRQCISDSEEVQKLSLQTYQCLYAAKYNPEDDLRRFQSYQKDQQDFETQFEQKQPNVFIEESYQKMSNDQNKTQEDICFIEQLQSCQMDAECFKQFVLSFFCVVNRCLSKSEIKTPEIYGQCIQNQCKSESKQIQEKQQKMYQCLYFDKYNQYDDKFVIPDINKTSNESHSSLIALPLITISILLLQF
ncbi:hypothetical protein TTHERM_01499960 (macronuclear) [Tetrahymena thermophila SB210]|uniref:Uncharacterized protein n=1 Tax=Tetrahymena thermophila (strain SB210) TaxID=312017 RepID=Q228T1_TETTS|nr:hypothetical protein TTHERM_01499960 [Tetrahymena thermophila SB210]EAR81804.1 hypothetical protein TTHERM_01499960 [Tetrahymena thermophila SB210]|eukprot:XP_001029467.1 hypothetical protein TTHERM_01499960 [Tetrahymena thermophila SB210]